MLVDTNLPAAITFGEFEEMMLLVAVVDRFDYMTHRLVDLSLMAIYELVPGAIRVAGRA